MVCTLPEIKGDTELNEPEPGFRPRLDDSTQPMRFPPFPPSTSDGEGILELERAGPDDLQALGLCSTNSIAKGLWLCKSHFDGS